MATIPANFTAHYTDNNSNVLWYLEIDGLRKRYGSRAPSWNPADSGTNRHIEPYFLEPGIPQIAGQKSKPLNGSTTPHSFTVELVDVGDALTALFSIHDDTTRNETTLTAACNDSTTTITVDDSTVFSYPCDIYVERETMRATARPTSTTITVTRGMYGSQAKEHRITDASGNSKSVVVSDKPLFMLTRGVRLYESRTGLAEADGIVLRGFLDSIEEDKGVWSVRCSGFLKQLTGKVGGDAPISRLIEHLRPAGTMTEEEKLILKDLVSEEFGFAVATDYCIIVEADKGYPASGVVQIDNELIRYEGIDTTTYTGVDVLFLDSSKKTLITSYPNMGKYWRTFTKKGRAYLITTIKTASDTGWIYQGAMSAFNEYARMHMQEAEVRHCLTDIDFTAGTSPVDVVLQLLLSGGDGGTYDTLPSAWGLGLPESAIDITGMESIRDELPGADTSLKFVINKEIEVKKWLEVNVLRPARLFFIETWDGKISLGRLYSKFDAEQLGAALAIDESILLDLPKINMGKSPVGRFDILCNYYPPEDRFYGKFTVIMGDRGDMYRGGVRNYKLECEALLAPALGLSPKSWYARSLGTLPNEFKTYMQTIWDRFALAPMPIVDVEIPYSYMAKVPVGSIATLKASQIPNPKSSSRGMNGEYFQVIEAHPLPMRSSVRLVLWMIDIHDKKYRYIAPSAKVKSYSSATKTITTYPHEFTSSSDSQVDAEYMSGADYIRLLDSGYNELTAGEKLDVTSYSSTQITLKTAPTVTPSDGDFVEVSMYDDVTSSLHNKWTWLADSNDKLGASNDQGDVRS